MPGSWRMFLLVLAFAGSTHGEQRASSQATPKAAAPATSASTSAAPPASNPTLKETTDWLETHLTGLIHTSRKTVINYRAKKGKDPKEVDRLATNLHESISVASFEGCSLTLGQLVKGDDYTVVTISQIPLDRISGASWKVSQYEPIITQNGLDSTETNIAPTSVASITLDASSNTISWRRKSSGNVPLDQDALPYEGRSASLIIESDDLAMPQRLVKAFNHAIDLCRVNVKPEPF